MFSFIIPVYNRPDEIDELLESLSQLDYEHPFEVVIVEDGSTVACDFVLGKYKGKLDIAYHYKENSGPGDSRNYGMRLAKGNYFIILDSDCILPKEYLTQVSKSLESAYVDCFGGPDQALESFSAIQKAINFSMTSFLTTGGIRGGSEQVAKFQPRSFNMGLSKKAFEVSNGFGNIHPGEDPDLSIRLWKLGFETKLIPEAYVYHKRRIDWNKFYIQVNKFGKARPILNYWYPEYAKFTFWLPSLFCIGFVLSVIFTLFGINLFLLLYSTYFIILFLAALWNTKKLKIALYSLVAVTIQFYGYGTGFLIAYWNIFIRKLKPEIAHPELFFKIKK
jgi:glycosyltransferase involved in cell wall biosynthesis